MKLKILCFLIFFCTTKIILSSAASREDGSYEDWLFDIEIPIPCTSGMTPMLKSSQTTRSLQDLLNPPKKKSPQLPKSEATLKREYELKATSIEEIITMKMDLETTLADDPNDERGYTLEELKALNYKAIMLNYHASACTGISETLREECVSLADEVIFLTSNIFPLICKDFENTAEEQSILAKARRPKKVLESVYKSIKK